VTTKNKKLKLKTHSGAAKRFKVTSTGKILRMHSGKRHFTGTKAAGRMRRLRKRVDVNPADVPNVRLALPYGLE
jgi:large subunit ribosomal protein L35